MFGRNQDNNPPSPAPAASSASTGSQGRKGLTDLLIAEGKLSPEQLQQAMQKQQETGAFIGEILAELGVLNEQSLCSFLVKHCRIPHLSLLDYLIDDDVLQFLSPELCLQHRLLPIDKMGRNLTVAMVNPLDQEAIMAVQNQCPDLRIKPILCSYEHFDLVSKKLFAEQRSNEGQAVLSATMLGLKREDIAPAPEPAPAPQVTTPPANDEEDIPMATEMVEEAVIQKSDTVIDGVFSAEAAAEAAQPAGEASAAETGVVQEMASAMMDSMRDTYGMLARRMDLFHGLDPESVARIFTRGVSKEIPANTVLFNKGDAAASLFVILGGSVLVYDGDQEIARLSKGDMFGEMALVGDAPRSASVCTLETSSVLELNKEVLLRTVSPEASLQLMANIVVTLSNRLRQANPGA